MNFKRTLFLFRRDLRFEDNTGLIEALSQSEEVVPAFIFDPRQLKNNPYFSHPCFDFMLDALAEIKPYCFEGIPEKILPKILKENGIEAVFANADYTPFALMRDKAIAKAVPFHLYDDALLHPPEEVLKSDGTSYTVFTPFYKAANSIPVSKPVKCHHQNLFRGRLKGTVPIKKGNKPPLRATREACLRLVRRDYRGYARDRDFLALKGTSFLSTYLKFTICSAREIFHNLSSEALRRQLYWRDFYTQISYHFPHVYGKAFKKVSVKWRHSDKDFEIWCQGKTGFPIVDAGMRQLNETGWMHNRARMITASFLTKDLQIDWRMGERYFANKLIDYDPAVNNGNWQWVASTGCDAQPYFRVFNPWSQQARFDPECLYIKKWIPELKQYSAKEIHNWEGDDHYPAPMLDHSVESVKAKALFST